MRLSRKIRYFKIYVMERNSFRFIKIGNNYLCPKQNILKLIIYKNSNKDLLNKNKRSQFELNWAFLSCHRIYGYFNNS